MLGGEDMDNNSLIEYYKTYHERKIFHTKLNTRDCNAHIMFIYDYKEEFQNFSSTFLLYLPYYVRSSDQLSTISCENIDDELIKRSKKIRLDKIIPKRRTEVDGLYGELFLDFYLRIVCDRKSLITYAKKRSFASNTEAYGPDNVVYYIENGKINVCFCEAKFIEGAAKAKKSLVEDINGSSNGKPSHISREFLNDYIGFMISQNLDISEEDKSLFADFIDNLNIKLDTTNEFVESMIDLDICCNFIFFAIFDSTRKKPDDLINYYKEIYDNADIKVKDLGISNYRIEVVFIPTNSKPLDIKKEIQKNYE